MATQGEHRSTFVRIDEKRATRIIATVKNEVAKWDKSAEKLGISRAEREMMSKAFRYE